MPLKIDKIMFDDYYINGKEIILPIKYLAYIDKNGYIRNLKGDIYSKYKINNYKNTELKLNYDIYYDIIKTDIILNCNYDQIIAKNMIFLVNDELYDICGNIIEILFPNEVQIEEPETEEIETEEIEEQPAQTEETEPEVQIDNSYECDFSNIIFENNQIVDEKNNINFYINGNSNFENNSFFFDGETFLKSNITKLTNPWTIRLSFKQERVIEDSYQSLICFSINGGNLFNILTKDKDIYIYANNQLIFIDDIGNNIVNNFNEIIVNSNGDIFIDRNYIKNVKKIDLSSGNIPFILGGDYNEDGSVNNYYIGRINKFGICNKIVDNNNIKDLKWKF